MAARERGNRRGMKPLPVRRSTSLVALLALLPLAGACGGHGGGAHSPRTLRTAATGQQVVITTDNGLRLRPADGDQITVDDRVDEHWSRHEDVWTLDLTCDDRAADAGDCPRMPNVEIPDGVRVTATATATARDAGVDVAGVTAALDITTVNGDVTLPRSGRQGADVRLSTRNGSVRATGVAAQRLHATTTSGDVVLGCATVPTAVTAATVNGSVDVTVPHDSPAYRVAATTDNGRARVAVPVQRPDRDRALTLTTVNGDVTARRD